MQIIQLWTIGAYGQGSAGLLGLAFSKPRATSHLA